jgi:hypothetical protein
VWAFWLDPDRPVLGAAADAAPAVEPPLAAQEHAV